MDELSKSILSRLFVLGSILWPLVMLSILFGGYRGIPWSAAISFRIDDGWCDPSAGQGIGAHCFGDFGYPYGAGGFESPYSPGNGVANNTPLTLYLFSLFSLVRYNFALVFYLFLLLLPTAAVAQWVGRLRGSPGLLFAQLFGGVASIGFLIGFDRGNHVVLILPLLALLLIAAEAGKFKLSILYIVLISLLKWWGPLFVVVFLAKRRLREAFLSFVLTIVGHGVLLLAYPSLSFSQRISSTLREIFNEDYALFVSSYAVSAKAWIGRMICVFGDADCSSVSPGQMIPSRAITVGVSLGIFAVVTVIASKLGLRHPYSVMAICSLMFLAVPEAAPYNLVGVSAAVVVLIHFAAKSGVIVTEGSTFGRPISENLASWWAAGALAFGVIPLGWYSFRSSGVALPVFFESLGDVRFAQLIVPPFWLGVLALGLVEVVRDQSRGQANL